MARHPVHGSAPDVSLTITNDAERIRAGCNGLVTIEAMQKARAAAKRIANNARYVDTLLGQMIQDAAKAERHAAREAREAERNNARILRARGIGSPANDLSIPAHA